MRAIVVTAIACVLASAPISAAQENGSAPEPVHESSLSPHSQPAGPPSTLTVFTHVSEISFTIAVAVSTAA